MGGAARCGAGWVDKQQRPVEGADSGGAWPPGGW